MNPLFLIIGLPCALFAWHYYRSARALRREAFIRSFTLPPRLFEALRVHHPHLKLKECQLVAQGLRQFFMAYQKSGHGYVSMPSQAADDLWHEFILHTRDYQQFCKKAFGGFLHHTPAVAIATDAKKLSQAGLQRCWWFACREENINPQAPTRLPLLFALDSKLKIKKGFHYVTDCTSLKALTEDGAHTQVIYCGVDFSPAAGADSASSSSDFNGCSADSSGDSGGDSSGGDSSCGGGGCGGGCGGGGGD